MEILEIITIGLPFCSFKIIAGLTFRQYWLVVLGYADLIVNLVNLFSVTIQKERVLFKCKSSVGSQYQYSS